MDATVQVGVLLQGVIAVLVTIITGLLTWALRRIICVDKKMEGMTSWKTAHEKLDDERHRENLGKFDMIIDAVKEIHRPQNWDA